MQTAKVSLANAEAAAQGAKSSFTEKEQLLEAAKRRVDELRARLEAAKSDLSSTNRAALKARAAARAATINARKKRGGDADAACHNRLSDKETKVTNLARKAAQQAKAASDAQNIAGARAAHQAS